MRKRLLSILLTLCLVLTLLPGTAWASVEAGQVDLRPTNEARWIDRVELPDYALTLYKTLEEAADGDGYKDYLIDDEYYDLEGDNVRTDVPGEFMRGTVTSSDGSTTRYTAILVTTTETDETDQNTKDYIANCIRTVVSAFKFDHQEVFWINGVYRVVFNRNDTRYYCLALCADYSALEEEDSSYYEIRRADFRPGGKWDIRSAMARRDADVEKILGTIPAGADRFMQIYYLNKWLAENNQYNTTVKKDGDGPWYAYECISALEGLSGADGPVCSGYASAFKVLCDKLGIPCVTVTGRVAENTGHRWNYVQMEDGEWYAVDVTYDDRNDNSANRTKWLLVGSKTVVNGKEFLETHPAHNRSYYAGGTDFTNGPILSDEAYPRGVHLAYTGIPEKLTPGDPVVMVPTLIFSSNAAYTYSSTGLPVGLTLDRYTGKITGAVSVASNAVTLTVTAVNPDDSADCAQCTLTFPAEEPHEFVDVPDWGAAEVNWGAAKGIVLGIDENLFGSFNTCTHDEILTFLWRAAGRPEAAQAPVATAYDIPDFQDAINWAYEKRIIDMSFQSGAPCTRASSVKYIWQATGMKSAPASDFPDVPSSAAYAPAVNWAVANGVTVGTGDGRFNPDSTCTRVEIVIFLYRAYDDIESDYPYADMEQQVLNSLLKRKASFTFTNSSEESLDRVMVDLIFNNAVAENQELVFYVAGFSFPSGFDILDPGQSVTLSPKYLSLSEEDAEAYRLAVEQACIECFGAAELSEMSQMTDFEKVVAAHDWVVAHCKYDPYTGNGNQDYVTAQGTVFSNNREVYSSYGAFVNRTAACQGYALSLKVLLDRANVPCCYVLANTDTLHHAWDLVQLDGTWYHVDTTWDDPALMKAEYDFAGYVLRTCFLQSDTECLASGHTGWRTTYGYTCNSAYNVPDVLTQSTTAAFLDPDSGVFYLSSGKNLNSYRLGSDFSGGTFITDTAMKMLVADYDQDAHVMYFLTGVSSRAELYSIDFKEESPVPRFIKYFEKPYGIFLRPSAAYPGMKELCTTYRYDVIETWLLDGIPTSSALFSEQYQTSQYYKNLQSVVLSGNYREDMIAVAESQIGYHAGESEDQLDGSYSGTGAFSEYGWYIGTNGTAWCSEFASWCARQAKIPSGILASSYGASVKVRDRMAIQLS